MCAFRLPRALTRSGNRGPSSPRVAPGRVGGLGGRDAGRGLRGAVARAVRGGLEPLESRVLLSAYYVSPNGSDAAAGTASAPFKTLQHGADLLRPGDTLIARAGTYAGFTIGWDTPQVGTAAAPITYEADPAAAPGSVVINTKNAHSADGIDLEPGNSYIVLKGFTINNAAGTITRAGIRVTGSDHVQVLDNVT